MDWAVAIFLIYLSLILVVGLIFVLDSIKEHEHKATQVGIIGTILVFVVILLVIVFRESMTATSLLIDSLFSAFLLIVGVSLIRTKANHSGTAAYIKGSVKAYDERDHMFARIRSLRQGYEYDTYYSMHPELKAEDDRRRALGGPLGIPGKIDRSCHPNLAMISALYTFPTWIGRDEVVSPQPSGVHIEIPPSDLSAKVKGFARHIGADLVGITELNPLWVFSHQGEIFYNNWEDWGKENKLDHRFAIVLATEMDRDLVMTGPHTPATIESTWNYSKGAVLSVQIASFLTHMGFRATAHHFRHYDVNLVPMAVDAGLGELGRNGYLITREFGPRVRLVAVTTNAELVPDKPVDLGIQHFCKYCKKCAHLCPSKSIPEGEKTVDNGIERWKLHAESCSTYWTKTGTDCGVCMAVCPWSHSRTLIHRVSTKLAIQSPLARRLLIHLDDWVYGNYRNRTPDQTWYDYRQSP